MSHRIALPQILDRLANYAPAPASDPNIRWRAAVAMILREHPAHGPELILIRRAEHPEDPWSGQMAFPGGHEDYGDETLLHAARRETWEEIGVPLEEMDRIGQLDDVIGGRLSQRRVAVTPFVFATSFDGPFVPNHEVADVLWIPLDFFFDAANVSPYRFPLDPEQRPFPSYVYRGYTVWGLTFQIIANLLTLHGMEYPLD